MSDDRKQCGPTPYDDDPELAALMATPDDVLLREAREKGLNIRALVKAMKIQIAERLGEVTRPSPRDAGRPPLARTEALAGWFRDRVRVHPGMQSRPTRIALDADIADLDLGPISYLLVLEQGWTLGRAATGEQDYRCWLQWVRDCPDTVIRPDADVNRYWECHRLSSDRYQSQIEQLFEGRLPRTLYPGRIGTLTEQVPAPVPSRQRPARGRRTHCDQHSRRK
jgi:hypothetical protein